MTGYPRALNTIQDLLHLLGGSIRLELLLTLHGGPRPVTEIAQKLELSLAHISHNLALLRSAELVTLTPVGRVHLYALSGLVAVTVGGRDWTLTASLPSGESVALSSRTSRAIPIGDDTRHTASHTLPTAPQCGQGPA